MQFRILEDRTSDSVEYYSEVRAPGKLNFWGSPTMQFGRWRRITYQATCEIRMYMPDIKTTSSLEQDRHESVGTYDEALKLCNIYKFTVEEREAKHVQAVKVESTRTLTHHYPVIGEL